MRRIYLDNNATTALDPKVAEVIMQDISSLPANPSSSHFYGREAKTKLLKARQTIASYLLVKQNEILFTSGGTESMNFLIRGITAKIGPCHIISSNVEHSCVEATLQDLEHKNYTVSYLPAGLSCRTPLEEIEKAILPNTKLLIFSMVNGETGVKQDIEGLSAIALRHNIALVLDGVAALGKEQITIPQGVTAIGFSGHKIHAPKGIGFVFLRSLTKISPLITGGGQEYGLRSGTENLTGIVALAKAISLLEEKVPSASMQMERLRNRFEQTIISSLTSVSINGEKNRICNVSNLSFSGVDAETLLIQLDLHGIAASHGSACSSGAMQPSKVLTNMGLPTMQVKSSLRFTLSRYTTEEEIDIAASTIISLAKALQ